MSAKPAKSLAELGATAARISRVHRRTYRDSELPLAAERFTGADRAAFRTEGRQLVGALLRVLDSRDAGVRAVAEVDAVQAIESTAARLAACGAKPREVIATYLVARRPFLAELAELGRRRDLDGPAITALYDEASALLDRLLLHLVAVHAAIQSEG